MFFHFFLILIRFLRFHALEFGEQSGRKRIKRDKKYRERLVMLMATLYSNSLKLKMLLDLRNYGPIKRAKAISTYPNYNRITVERVVTNLLESGLIEEYKKAPAPQLAPVRYIQISDRGRDALIDYEAEKGQYRADRTVSTIKENSRKELVLPVYAICTALGVMTTQEEKPPLEALFFQSPNTHINPELTSMLDEQGVFYSMNEIRTTTKKHIGDGPLNQVRCIGIIIRDKRVYFVYNMGNKLIYFNRTLETRTRDLIVQLIDKSTILKEYGMEVRPQLAGCILFGDTYRCIPKVIFGRKSGEKAEVEDGVVNKAEKMRDALAEHNISLSNISRVFNSIYFVPIRASASVFDASIRMTPAYRYAITEKWIQMQPSLRAEKCQFGLRAVSKNTGTYVYVWPDNDLTFLSKMRQANHPAHVVIPVPGAEDAIARVLGPNLLSVQLLTGGTLKTKRYDFNGKEIKGEAVGGDSV